MFLLALPLGVGKARLTLFSIECFVWGLGQRFFLVFRGFWVCGPFGFCGFSLDVLFGFSFAHFLRSFLCILRVYLGAAYTF
jgi:hypothetical protein